MIKAKSILRRLHPPDGCQIRKLIGIIIVFTGLVRIFGTDPALAIQPSMVHLYGILQVIIGIILLATNHRHRCKLIGRISAALAVGLLTILVFQFWPYPTGFAYIIFAYSLLTEVMANQQCDCVTDCFRVP